MTMTKNTSVALGEHFDTFISNKLEFGRYRNASEIIREGLRKIEEEDVKLEALRKILGKGEQDIKEGRCKSYGTSDELMKDISEGIEARKKVDLC